MQWRVSAGGYRPLSFLVINAGAVLSVGFASTETRTSDVSS
jgi:hypothetical protein